MQITGGALLLASHRDETYSVWAHRGLDETSRHRIQIPRNDLAALMQTLGLDSVADTQEKIRSIAPYLSNLQASMLATPLLLAFPDESPQTLLLILHSPLAFMHSESVKLLLTAIGEPIIAALDNAWLRQIRTAAAAVPSTREEFLAAVLKDASHSDLPGRLIALDPTPLLESLTAEHPELDRFRCFQDLESIIGLSLAQLKLRFSEPTGSLWLYFPHGVFADTELLIAHLEQLLRKLFGRSRSPALLSYHEFELDTPPEDLADVLHDILFYDET